MNTSPKINLKSIRKYNPGTLDDQDVINNYISRQEIFQKLIDEIKTETKKSIPQHYLIIGQRGMGKTTLLKRIEVEVKTKKNLNKKFVPVLYPEEQYNIDRLSKFWFNTLDQLLDYIDVNIGVEETIAIDEQVQQIIHSYEEEILSDKAYELVRLAISKINKRPILLIDNIDQLFSLLNEKELWQVRQKITDNGAPIFIGASSSPFDEVFEYDQAFYDHFKTKYLNPLTEDQFTQLIQTLASNLENDQLKLEFRQNETRIKSLYRLAGGNIRTAIILFTSLTNGFGDSISDDLDELLDEMTPIYKARVEELSDQLKAIIDEIALEHKPIDLERLRERTRIPNNTLSPQIRRLRRMGWISKEGNIKSKTSYYQITERFFNVWYLMRRSTRRNKRNISVLSAFLKVWIDNKDKQGEILLNQQITRSSDITTRLALSEHIGDNKIKAALISQAQEGIKFLSSKDPSISKRFAEYNDEKERSKMPKWFDEFTKLTNAKEYKLIEKLLQNVIKRNKSDLLAWAYLGNLYQDHIKEYEKSREAYERALKIDEKFVYAWNNLGNLYQDHIKEYEKSREAYERVIELDENNIDAWNNLGNLYQDHIKEYEKSREAYERVIELDENNIDAWNNLGNLYQDHLKEYEKSREAYERVIELDENDIDAWNNLGNLYQNHLKEYEKSRESYERAIELDEKYVYAWNGLGNLYQNHLKKYEKSRDAYQRAIELDEKYVYAWYNLGNLYQGYLKEYEKSRDAYQRAIKFDEKFVFAWNNLGTLYQNHLMEYEKSRDAYVTAIQYNEKNDFAWTSLGYLYKNHLKEYEKSKEAYERAIELNEKNVFAWYSLGNLYQYPLNEYEKSREAYERAIELDEKYIFAWYDLGNLYQNHLKEYEKSKEAYERAIELNEKNIFAWNGLGNLYQDHLKNHQKALECYNKALLIEPEKRSVIYNLTFLYRDIKNNVSRSKEIFKKLDNSKKDEFEDTYYLHQSLFQVYDQNFGLAKGHLLEAIKLLNLKPPVNTMDDWVRYAAVAIHKGFGEIFIETLKSTGIHNIIRPYYDACIALHGGGEDYLYRQAVEVRETAFEVYEYMKKYKSMLHK